MLKPTYCLLVALLVSGAAHGQGTINFNNRIPGVVDGRFFLPDGTGMGAGWTAQLLIGGGLLNVPLTRLTPTTTFKTSIQADLGYVNPVIVAVPGLLPGTEVFAEIRATLDANPLCRVESGSVLITLGGNGRPPAVLAGLPGTIPVGDPCIPEPTTVGLLALGSLLVCFAQRFRSK